MNLFWQVGPIVLSAFALGYLVGYGLRSVIARMEMGEAIEKTRRACEKEGA